MNDNKKYTVNASEVKKDDLMAFLYYGRVETVGPDQIQVYDIDNQRSMFITGKDLIESSYSADQFDDDFNVSKTKLAEILISSANRPFTVCFTKADGAERILRGRLVAPEPLLGRSTVEDLDVSTNNRLRLVDHRTLKWLVVDGTKFWVK